MPVYSVTCTLPPSVPRGGASAPPPTRYALPQSVQRAQTVPTGTAHAYALGGSGVTCQPPRPIERSGASGGGAASMNAAPVRIALPMAVSRDSTIPRQTEAGSPQPEPGPASQIAPAAPQDRAHHMIETFAPIVERVARGISGAAGYCYIGEDPGGAGLRYGLLGLRLDTGDMGAALALARDRDPAGFSTALNGQDTALMAAATAPDAASRTSAVAGKHLYEDPWKSLLSNSAGRDIFRAAQNEYAVVHLLRPAADLILPHAALASGTALAMALDVLAEMGREAGLAAIVAALDPLPETARGFGHALVRTCLRSRLRLEDLARDPALADWRPTQGRAGGTAS